MNNEVVEILMDFVDYGKFKKTMLEFKMTDYTTDEKAAIALGIVASRAQFEELCKEDINDTTVWTK